MKINTIIHLCLAFTVLAWHIIYPYMGEWYDQKSKKLLYENIMTNTKLFESLSYEEQNYLQNKILEHKKSYRWKEISPYEQGWIFFSIVLGIMALLHIEGVQHAVWILPLLVIFYGLDNPYRSNSKIEDLYPSEHFLIEKYLNGKNAGSISEQQKQLEFAWNRYLVDEWGSDLKSARFNFNLAQLKILLSEEKLSVPQKSSPFFIMLYFFWNLIFAFSVKRGYSKFQTAQCHAS